MSEKKSQAKKSASASVVSKGTRRAVKARRVEAQLAREAANLTFIKAEGYFGRSVRPSKVKRQIQRAALRDIGGESVAPDDVD